MKKFLSILIAFIALVSFVHVQAQRVFKPTDVIDGKTVLQQAQKMDVEAFLQTKEIYKPGMTETEFVNMVLGNFPSEANSIKPLFYPYYKYIYSLHKKGLSEAKITSTATGTELATLCTSISKWNANNPGQIVDFKKWNWKIILQAAIDVITLIIQYL